jgi:hypothetical protein
MHKRSQFERLLQAACDLQHRQQAQALAQTAEPTSPRTKNFTMRRETKFGYGFCLAGIGLAYLIDEMLGLMAAIILSSICVVIGGAFIISGHFHREDQERESPRRLWGWAIAGCALITFIVLISTGVWRGAYRHSEGKKEVPEPSYPLPKGPGIRFDASIPIPSNQLCQGLTGKAETDCLCPRGVNYSLKTMAAPSDNNYATELTATQSREPMYRIRIFSRANISFGMIIQPSEDATKARHGICTYGALGFDQFSVILQCTFPVNEFRVALHTSEGLRLKCINQEN